MSEALAFVGRFHVLAVHLPIGVIALAAGLEATSVSKRLRGRFDDVLGPVLGIAPMSGIVAYLLGTTLAREGGHAKDATALQCNAPRYRRSARCCGFRTACWLRAYLLDACNVAILLEPTHEETDDDDHDLFRRSERAPPSTRHSTSRYGWRR